MVLKKQRETNTDHGPIQCTLTDEDKHANMTQTMSLQNIDKHETTQSIIKKSKSTSTLNISDTDTCNAAFKPVSFPNSDVNMTFLNDWSKFKSSLKLKTTVNAVTDGFGENAKHLVNEPSESYYYIRNNIEKEYPQIVKSRLEIKQSKQKLVKLTDDIKNGEDFITCVEGAIKHLDNIKSLLQYAVCLQNHINELDNVHNCFCSMPISPTL